MSSYSEDMPISDKKEALKKVNELSGREVEMYDLDTYWKSQGIEEFCTVLATEIIPPGSIAENQILDAIKLIRNEEDIDAFDYLLNKYSDAIEFHFRKPSGTLFEVLNNESIDTLDKVVDELTS